MIYKCRIARFHKFANKNEYVAECGFQQLLYPGQQLLRFLGDSVAEKKRDGLRAAAAAAKREGRAHMQPTTLNSGGGSFFLGVARSWKEGW